MINYTKNKNDLPMYIKDIYKNIIKPYLILELITMALIVFLLTIGYLKIDIECLKVGYFCLAFFIFFIFVLVLIYFTLKSKITKTFDNYSVNGIIESSIGIEDDFIVIKNNSIGTIYKIRKNDIVKVYFNKKTICITTNLNLSFIFPQMEEIEKLFDYKK